jgi:5'(3')-deoxyribonucleotidase
MDEITDIFIDMDGVLADFQNSKYFTKIDKVMRKPPRMYESGFFENLEVLPGARWGVRVLLKNPKLRLHILTKPVTNSHLCYSEKAAWIAKHFPELLDSIIIAHDKQFCAGPGRVLIDDYAQDWKASWEAAGGTFWHFQSDSSRNQWIEIGVKYNPEYFNLGEL